MRKNFSETLRNRLHFSFKIQRSLFLFFALYLLHSDKLKGSETYFNPQIFSQYREEPEDLTSWLRLPVEHNPAEIACEENKRRPAPVESQLLELSGQKIEKGGIGFINGIYNTLESAEVSVRRIHGYAQGHLISYVYNASYSFLSDVSGCLLGYMNIVTTPVLLLVKQWEEFFSKQGLDATFLQIAHSQGALHVRNALGLVREEIRSRIIVLSFAPAALIAPDLCGAVYQYVSKKDVVPYFDIAGSKQYKEHLIVLEPHPEAEGWMGFDHEFDSPTFQSILIDKIQEYLMKVKAS